MRVVQVFDHIGINGFKSSFQGMVHFRRKATIIEKELNAIVFDNETLIKNGMKFEAIIEALLFENITTFKFHNRRLKAVCYLKNNYTGHCLIKDNMIVGDLWYFAQKSDSKALLHPDINLLKIPWDKSYAYSFDTFIDPDNRGNNVAKALLNNSLYSMAKEGYKKAYGYYWKDNLPAIWNARAMNKFKEVGSISISRLFFFRFSHKERVPYGKNKN
jgi:hypothetical protein